MSFFCKAPSERLWLRGGRFFLNAVAPPRYKLVNFYDYVNGLVLRSISIFDSDMIACVFMRS